jgi:hypothetical protein
MHYFAKIISALQLYLERLNQAKDVIDNPMKADKPPISERYFNKRSKCD